MKTRMLRWSVFVFMMNTAWALPPGGNDGRDPPDEDPPIVRQCRQATKGTLAVAPTKIKLGQEVSLNWSVGMPSQCQSLGRPTLNREPVAAAGSRTAHPMSYTVYELKFLGSTLASARVQMQLPPTVRIKGGTEEWRGLLFQALATPNTLVLLGATVEMDLTGYNSILIAQGVTLTSEAPPPGSAPPGTTNAGSALPAAEPAREHVATKSSTTLLPGSGTDPTLQYTVARTPRTLGPRLFTHIHPAPLFLIKCDGGAISGDNVRIIGFRLQGPNWDSAVGDENEERGIQVSSCRDVEIANMEISGWSGQGIWIEDPLKRQVERDPKDDKHVISRHEPWIHDNFIHHNQHVADGDSGSWGYGVVVYENAYALIERNVFDFNRHAIAANGEAGGYTAKHNLVLKGGGFHGQWYEEYTHQFDVHGTTNCKEYVDSKTLRWRSHPHSRQHLSI
jgi:hypothetical protein